MRGQSPFPEPMISRNKFRNGCLPTPKPLDFVLVGVRMEAEQARYPPVQVTERVRVQAFGFERQPARPGVPARAAPEIAARSSVRTVASLKGDG